MKKSNQKFAIILGLISLIVATNVKTSSAQTPISDMMRAQNYWMPHYPAYGHNNGQVDLYWQQIKTSGVKYMRIGGKSYDQENMFAPDDLKDIIDRMRSYGVEPIVQIPINPTLTIAQNAAEAGSLVAAMNTSTRLAKPVQYWIIGNEPNKAYTGTYTTAATIAAYTRSCSVEMRAEMPSITIIGPSLTDYISAYYTDFLSASTNNNSIMGSGPDGPYINAISVNCYPISLSKMQATTTARQEIIENLRDANNFADILNSLKTKAVASGRSDLKIMITEANMSTVQDINHKGADKFGPGSFLGGQFWAEMMAIGMEKGIASIMPWSVVEGTGSDSYLRDIGYISKETTTNTASPHLRPSYYHYEAMANRFKGDFYPSTAVTGTNGSTTNKIKAWAAKDGEKVVVMVQNQYDAPGSFPFQVCLNSTSAAGTGTANISFAINGLASNSKYASNTASLEIKNESTVLLTFNCQGAFGWRHDYTISNATTTPDPGFQEIHRANPTTMVAGQVTINPINILVGDPYSTANVSMTPSNYTFTWSSPSGCSFTPSPTGTNVALAACLGDDPARFSYTVTDQNGCSMTEEMTVTPDVITCMTCTTKPYISVTPSDCGKSDGKVIADCGDFCIGVTYSWDGATPISTSSIGGLSPGAHYVVIRYYDWEYFQDWVDKRLDFNITISGTIPPVFAGFNFSKAQYCKVTLVATPNISGHTYEWFSGNSQVPLANTRVYSLPHWSGKHYRVKVTDASGCVNEDWVYAGRMPGTACAPAYFNAMIPCDRLFNATNRSMTGIETETLSVSTTIDQDTYFDKILTVPAGKTLTLQDCIVAFSSSAHIVVEDYGAVIINNTFSYPCDSPLFSFYVGNGDHSTLRMTKSGIEGNNIAIDLNGTQGYFEGNTFARSKTAVKLQDCENVEFINNLFYETPVGIRSGAFTAGTGLIQSNRFELADSCIVITNGDHSMLSITCNTLDYSTYGIYSEGTLSDFGTQAMSPGNLFISANAAFNHQLHHNGNPIIYYCGALNSFNLTGDESCDATVLPADDEMVCPDLSSDRRALPVSVLPASVFALEAYPNPSGDVVNIIATLPEGVSAGVLTLFEVGSGKLLLAKELSAGETQVSVNLQPYAASVFAAVFRSATGEQKCLKLLKTQ